MPGFAGLFDIFYFPVYYLQPFTSSSVCTAIDMYKSCVQLTRIESLLESFVITYDIVFGR